MSSDLPHLIAYPGTRFVKAQLSVKIYILESFGLCYIQIFSLFCFSGNV